MAAEWSSLEVAKLIVSVATPVVVVGLGVVVTQAARRVEEAQWSNRKLIEKRLELYDMMAGPLNDLYCFFRTFGQFREVTPPIAIKRKRALDKAYFASKFLMTPEFSKLYEEFIKGACFDPGKYQGEDAKLRSTIARQKAERGRWDDAWDGLFVTDPAEVRTDDSVEAAYEALMQRFAADCGVTAADALVR